MGVCLYFTAQEPVSESVEAAIRAEQALLQQKQRWILCETPWFFPSEPGRPFQGITKLNIMPHPDEAVELNELEPDDIEVIVTALCDWSERYGVCWVLEIAGERQGRIERGQCESCLWRRVRETAEWLKQQQRKALADRESTPVILPPGCLRLVFQHKLSDVLELNCSVREQRIKAWLTTLMGVVVFLIVTWATDNQNDQADRALGFIVAFVFLLLGQLIPWIAGLAAWFFKVRQTHYEMEIGLEGITLLEGTKQVLVPWECFRRWYQTLNLVVLVLIGSDALVIPKRCCCDARLVEVLALVMKGLGNPSRW